MSRRAAVTGIGGWVIAGTIFLCFPGIVPFNRARPFVFGMPFVMAWVALWVVLALVVFVVADHTLGRRAGSD